MATWTYQRRTVETEKTSALASKPKLLFRKNGPVVFTRKYVKHTLFSKKEYVPGTEGMIVDMHTGPLGGVTHVNIRLGEGEFVNNVPVEYFRAAQCANIRSRNLRRKLELVIINRIPEAPVGICVTFDDDTEVPIEVGYQGLNEEGEHLWLQVSPDTLPRSKLKSYHMDKLPENTVIRFVINEFA